MKPYSEGQTGQWRKMKNKYKRTNNDQRNFT